MPLLSLMIFLGGIWAIYIGIRVTQQKDITMLVGGNTQPREIFRTGGSVTILGITALLSGLIMALTALIMWQTNQFSTIFTGFIILFLTQVIGFTFSTISYYLRKVFTQ